MDLLWLIPLLPFVSFLILTLFGRQMSKNAIASFGAGSIGLSTVFTFIVGISYMLSYPAGNPITQVYWEWFSVAGLTPQFAFTLDNLSLVFVFVITFVGFLIHLFSVEFMKEEEGYARFFASMNLFVCSMLILVLANNLVLLYLGWEGVGLCSFLLIGFYYKEAANGYAARKAFVVTRIGDTAMAIGLFLLFYHLGTLNIREMLHEASNAWAMGDPMVTAAALLLLGGAVGKSAQLPLQTWLPDAMAGPSPVSALIHAATMVTAGVYLIARTYTIFTLSPIAMNIVAIIGAATLLIAGFSAITQRDIKRVLAYSTISQIGYMFLALGVGAWSAAVFHFMIHGFFKALLFLGAGVVIVAMHDEHDMFKMGGLRHKLPTTFWTFLIASASLAALPLITAGFYSKDMILWYAFASPQGSTILWLAGYIGAFITAIYTFRMIFATFYGESQMEVHRYPGMLVKIPLVILGVLSLAGGFIELPHTLGHVTIFSGFIEKNLPSVDTHHAGLATEAILQAVAGITAIIGIYIAYLIYLKKSFSVDTMAQSGFSRLLNKGWGFDQLYDALFVKPFVIASAINKKDFIDKFYTGLVGITRGFHRMFSLTQTGQLRYYLMGIAFGSVVTLTIIVFLWY